MKNFLLQGILCLAFFPGTAQLSRLSTIENERPPDRLREFSELNFPWAYHPIPADMLALLMCWDGLYFNPTAVPRQGCVPEESYDPKRMLLLWEYVDRFRNEIVANPLQWDLLHIRLLQKKGLHDEALTNLHKIYHTRKGFEHTPASRFTLLNISGQLYLAEGRYSLARQSFRQARRLVHVCRPDMATRAQLYKDLTESYFHRGPVKKGIRTCDEFLAQVNEQSPEVTLAVLLIRSQKARLYDKAGKHKKAIAGYESLVDAYPRLISESDPLFISVLNNLANAYRKDQDNHHAYVYLRWAYEKLNEQTSPDREQAIEVITNLAEVYSTKGDMATARYHFMEADRLGQTPR